jgi:hypothetical protein
MVLGGYALLSLAPQVSRTQPWLVVVHWEKLQAVKRECHDWQSNKSRGVPSAKIILDSGGMCWVKFENSKIIEFSKHRQNIIVK